MSNNYNPKHAKKNFKRDFLERYSIEIGVTAGVLIVGAVLLLLTQIKIPV